MFYEVPWQIQETKKFESLKEATNKVKIDAEVLFAPMLRHVLTRIYNTINFVLFVRE